MDKILGDGLKKLVLLGIGAAAVTAEKSQQLVDDLVKKGEITVEQGKELNQELQRSVKKSFDEISADAKEIEEEVEKDASSIEKKIADMTAEELENLKDLISKAENAFKKED